MIFKDSARQSTHATEVRYFKLQASLQRHEA
jgi:hypothetical protein